MLCRNIKGLTADKMLLGGEERAPVKTTQLRVKDGGKRKKG
jgi:hypothetical protein